jgi:hypothetical protein
MIYVSRSWLAVYGESFMKNVLKVFVLVAFVGILGIGVAEAQYNDAKATPTPRPVPPAQGRCIFPSSRALSAVISDEARKIYLKAGYKQVFVGVRVVIKKPIVSVLTTGNVTGIKGIAPQTGSPANLLVTANPGGAPIELGCNAEADMVTSVALVDSAGKRINGRTTAKVIVQGAFN